MEADCTGMITESDFTSFPSNDGVTSNVARLADVRSAMTPLTTQPIGKVIAER